LSQKLRISSQNRQLFCGSLISFPSYQNFAYLLRLVAMSTTLLATDFDTSSLDPLINTLPVSLASLLPEHSPITFATTPPPVIPIANAAPAGGLTILTAVMVALIVIAGAFLSIQSPTSSQKPGP